MPESVRQASRHVNPIHARPACCTAERRSVGMNNVASVSWISVLVLVAIVVIALMAYNR